MTATKITKNLGDRPKGPPKTIMFGKARFRLHSKGLGNLSAVVTVAEALEAWGYDYKIAKYKHKWASTRGPVTTYAVYKRKSKTKRKKRVYVEMTYDGRNRPHGWMDSVVIEMSPKGKKTYRQRLLTTYNYDVGKNPKHSTYCAVHEREGYKGRKQYRGSSRNHRKKITAWARMRRVHDSFKRHMESGKPFSSWRPPKN